MPVLPVAVITLTGVLSAVFVVPWGSTAALAVICWLTIAIFASLMTWYAHRATRLMPDPTPERRFWKVFVVAGTMFSIADWIQVATTLADPNSITALTGTGIARTVALGCGGAAVIGVMATFPLPHRSARERLCYHLDLATVVTAVGSFGLYWAVTGSFAAGHVVGVAAGPVVAMLVAFAVGRVYLSGATPFRWHIGVMGPAAAALEALARALGPEMARTGRPGPVFALSLGCHALLLISAWLQHRRYLSGQAAPTAPRRRPYSLMPYLALAGIYLLLITTLLVGGLDLRAWIAQVGAVLCTGIVVARQLTAFIDNAQLLAERDSLTQRLHAMAFTDSLTGLANRARFLDRVGETLAGGGPAGVLLIDLDDFKPVNDLHGHAAGDAVLMEAASRLEACVGPAGLVARLGGDEFAVLLDRPPPDGFTGVAQRIVTTLGAPCRLPGGGTATVRASVGLAIAEAAHLPNGASHLPNGASHLPGDAAHSFDAASHLPGGAARSLNDASLLLKRADQAMYQAKNRGKGAFAVAA
ncbi:diguanylate cyclase domain-containing protein [Actinoplanes subglobosus]|uniref:Diguanylate cyclase domain-containing protein n=1 Tax=Actinoplanes subglobosus TaxID=1547892 RepID=A0ABV8J9P2_9ACTN